MNRKTSSKLEIEVSFRIINSNLIDSVKLSPAMGTNDETEGICGRIGGKCSLFYRNNNNEDVCYNRDGINFDQFADYWR